MKLGFTNALTEYIRGEKYIVDRNTSNHNNWNNHFYCGDYISQEGEIIKYILLF